MPFHLHVAVLAKWLLSQAGSAIFGIMQQKLAKNMGLTPRELTVGDVKTLLEENLQHVEERLAQRIIDRFDQERLIRLRSAIMQINIATTMSRANKHIPLGNAWGEFSYIANLPQQGDTAGIPNIQLCCLAYLGIAAIHMELNEAIGDIAKNIAAAIYTDPVTARNWFGDNIIDRLLTICPKCGYENISGAKFCKRDGQPLHTSVGASSSKHGTPHSQRMQSNTSYCPTGHETSCGSTSCFVCGIPITASYCLFGHENPSGSAVCTVCKTPLC